MTKATPFQTLERDLKLRGLAGHLTRALATVGLITFLEKEFQIELDVHDTAIERFDTIHDIVATVRGGTAHCTCNGEVLEAALKVPETGGIGLEADRGQMEYRNIRLR